MNQTGNLTQKMSNIFVPLKLEEVAEAGKPGDLIPIMWSDFWYSIYEEKSEFILVYQMKNAQN